MDNLKQVFYQLVKDDSSLFDFINDAPNQGIWFWQMDNPTDKWVSPAFWQALGYEQVQQPDIEQYIHPDELEHFKVLSENHRSDTNHFEFRLRCENSGLKYILFQCSCKTLHYIINGKKYRCLRLTEIRPSKIIESATHSHKLKFTEQIINSADLATWEWNIQTDEANFNDAWAEMLGFKLSEIADGTIEVWRKIAHPEDLIDSERHMDDYLSGRSNHYRMEARMKHRNGHYIWVLGQGHIVTWDESGRPEWLTGFHQQITESKAIFEAIRESEERYRMLFFQNPAPMWIFDLESLFFVEVNKAAIEHYGYSYDEFMAMKVTDIRPIEEIPKVLEAIESINNIPRANRLWLHKKKNGEHINASVSGFKIFYNRRPAYQAIVHDITNEIVTKKLLEDKAEQLRYVLGGSKLGLWDWNAQSGKLEVDNRWKEILGLEANSPDPTIEQWHERVHPEDFPKLLHLMDTVINNPYGKEFSVELRAKHANGHYIWIYDAGSVMERDANGAPVRVSGTHLDITPRKMLEQSLENERLRFKSIIDNIPVMIVQYDTNYRILFQNIAFGSKVGWEVKDDSLEDLIEKCFPDPAYRALVAKHMENTETRWSEFTLTTSYGHQIDSEWAMIRQEDGSIIGIGLDISERIETLSKLKKANLLNSTIERAQSLFISDDNKKTALEQLLADFLEITNSGYGFIGEIHHTGQDVPYLKTHAITDISWDESSKLFFEANIQSGLEFHNLDTLFGAVIKSGKEIIANDPSSHPMRGGLPHGHPPLDSFAGLPVYYNNEMIGMIGLANRPKGYDNDGVRYLEPLIATVGQLLHSLRIQRQEMSLRQNLRDLSLIATQTDNLVIITDAQGHIEYVNESFEQNTGYQIHEVIGRKPGEFLQGMGTDPEHIAKMREGIASLKTFTQEILNYTKDGRPYWISCTIDPIFTSGGELEKFIAIELDITELVESNRALTKVKEMLEQTNGIARVGGWEVNFDTNEIYWSKVTKEIHEVHEDYMPALQTAINFYKEGESRDTITKSVENLINNGVEYEIDLQIITNRGKEKWVRTKGQREYVDGVCKRIYGAFQDIDASKRAKLALSKSIDEFETLVSMIPVGIFKINDQGKFIYVSPVWCQMIGMAKEAVMENNLLAFDVIHPEDRDEFLRKNIEAQASKNEFETETRFIVDGKERWMHIHSFPHQADDGTWYWFGTQNDITRRKEAILALSESQKMLDLFFNQSLSGFFFMMLDEPKEWNESIDKEKMVDYIFENQRVSKVNKAMTDQYGMSEEEMIGQKFSDFFKHDVVQGKRLLRELLSAGSLQNQSIEQAKDGSLIYIDGHYTLLYDHEGRIIGHFGVQQDITHRKQIETELLHTQEKLQSIMQEMTDVIWSVRLPDYKLIFITPSIEKMRGNSPEKMLGSSGLDVWQDAIHPEDKPSVVDVFDELKEKGYAERDYRIIDQHQNIKWIQNKAKVIFDKGGNPIRLDGVASDITFKKEKEAEMKDLLTLTKDQNDRLTNFTHIVSHNLRSHTANIEGLLYILLHKHPHLIEDEVMGMFKGAAKNLDETIHHLNEVISITSTKESFESINLHEMVEKTIANVQISARDNEVEIFNDVEKHVNIEGLPAYVESIILNLITNGIKYRSDDRPSKIQLSTIQKSGFAVLSVTDNGLGIDLDKFGKKMFGMYKTFHKNKDARGIGLFISKNQIEAMGGKIEVESKVNEGTTFKLFFKHG